MTQRRTAPSPKPRPPSQVLTLAPGHLQIRNSRQITSIHVLADDLFRIVQHAPGQSPPASFAVVHTPSPETVPAPRIRQTRRRVSVETAEARIDWDLTAGTWTLWDRHGLEVFRALPVAPDRSNSPGHPRLTLELADRESLFGLGETTGTFDKRGLIREFWNIDVLGHSPAIHPGLRSLYVSIPFAISLRDGRAAGLFWDNPGRQTWDLGATHADQWAMQAATGIVDLYLFTGPRVEDVVRRFTELTGRTPLPPRWALGYQQSRYSYESREELEAVAREFRRRRIPCDVLYCDIHHLDGNRVFTFGKSFPEPARMLRSLARRGFRVVPIVNPGVKDDPRFGVSKRGKKRRAFVRDASGRSDFIGEVWPGRSRFPDFFHARVRAWWAQEQETLLSLGVGGVWNDMNEPANFARPDKTLDPECRHDTDHGPQRHGEIHNAYGLLMARASYEGFPTAPEAPRPFVLTRAGYAGIQRYAAVWTGDNSSCWEHLGDSLRQNLGLGLSGVAFAGSDVGGFLDHATPELFVRWLQMAVFTPFLRNHSNLGTRRQEPWAFGPQVEEITRNYLNLRYQLLPYLYGLFAEATRTGTPITRPLLWHFPGDPTAVACADQFLLGSSLLVAPMLQPGAVARSVYLPRGEWFDFWTCAKITGPVHVCVDAPLDRIPLFVRAGSLLPMTETRPFVGAREPETVVLHVWPDDHGQLEWYDDDGLTQAWRQGVFHRRRLTHRATDRGGVLTIGAADGRYAGHARTWRVLLRGLKRQPRVTMGRTTLAIQWVSELALAAFDLPATPQALSVEWR